MVELFSNVSYIFFYKPTQTDRSGNGFEPKTIDLPSPGGVAVGILGGQQ